MNFLRNRLNIMDRTQDIRNMCARDQDGLLGEQVLEIRSLEFRVLFSFWLPPFYGQFLAGG